MYLWAIIRFRGDSKIGNKCRALCHGGMLSPQLSLHRFAAPLPQPNAPLGGNTTRELATFTRDIAVLPRVHRRASVTPPPPAVSCDVSSFRCGQPRPTCLCPGGRAAAETAGIGQGPGCAANEEFVLGAGKRFEAGVPRVSCPRRPHNDHRCSRIGCLLRGVRTQEVAALGSCSLISLIRVLRKHWAPFHYSDARLELVGKGGRS